MVTKTFIIRAYTIGELARLYNVSKPTMRKWLKPFRKEIGVIVGHFYMIKQVKVIVENIGEPIWSGE